MQEPIDHERLKSDLVPHWLIVGLMLSTLAAYIVACHTLGNLLQHPLPEEQRVLIRTLLYAIAIVTLPLTNLIRHIQLRLNQTMPGENSAKSRYLTTIIVSMSLTESVGIFGFIMYVLGDDFNTLYILTSMSALGMLLYRPKMNEYIGIIEARTRAKP